MGGGVLPKRRTVIKFEKLLSLSTAKLYLKISSKLNCDNDNNDIKKNADFRGESNQDTCRRGG